MMITVKAQGSMLVVVIQIKGEKSIKDFTMSCIGNVPKAMQVQWLLVRALSKPSPGELISPIYLFNCKD